jgi:hypothetical protein
MFFVGGIRFGTDAIAEPTIPPYRVRTGPGSIRLTISHKSLAYATAPEYGNIRT